jgi:TP901 family phage tail tape measure protein
MPREKKVVVGLELKDKEFLKGLSSITTEVKKVGEAVAKMTRATGGDFSQLATKIDQTKGAVGTSNQTMTKMLAVLKEIRGHMADLKSAVGSTNTHLDTLGKTAGRTETGIRRVGESVSKVRTDLQGWQTAAAQANTTTNQLAQSGNALVQANNQVAQSFHGVATAANADLQDAQNAYQNLADKAGNVFSGLKKGKSIVGNVLDTFNPARIGEAAGWNIAYSIANAPGKIAGAVKNAVSGAVQSTQQLEGELFDLEAYLGGPNGQMLVEFGKNLGAVGSEEQMKTAGITALQNKILEIGQKSSFTALDIAKAATAAAKAGVTIEELAGKTGTALNAINLLSQNTGESLESSATQVSKLQALFEGNLNRTQESFGKLADAGEQYQIIVDGLAAADSSSAASAQQLTEALFNVGGSASNLNVSFFETMSLVSQMVPAFESAASAGTSLKYVFSGISGGRSIKAKGAMKQLGLMDEVGQSVFFDEKGFKGIEFMTKKLREVFGENSGMAVDVKNRIITDIFGQDALKAVARMVEMTDEQAEEMYKMAADMTQNARDGVRSAESIADIKNEGLEYDMEFFKGTLDSLQKTLTMPLMKPMSNIVQTFSGIGNAIGLVMSDAADIDKQMADTRKELIETSLLPGAGVLFDAAAKYAVNLREVIKIIGKDGFTISSISTALASLFGASGKELDEQGERFRVLLTKIYNAVESFVKNLPSLLEQVGSWTVFAFENMASAMSWIIDNWDSLLNGFKLMLGLMAVDKVASMTNNILDLGVALGSVAQASSRAGGFFANILAITQPTGAAATGIGGLIQKLAGGAATAAPAATQLNMFAPATAAAAGQLGIMTKLMGLWTGLSAAVGGFIAPLTTVVGWTNLLTGAFALLTSPIVIATAVVVAFVYAFQNNIAGMQTFIVEKFGFMWTYIQQTMTMIGEAIIPIWTWISAQFTAIGQSAFMDGIANIFKSMVVIIQGALLTIGGVLKIFFGLFQGLITGNWDLLKSGASDAMYGIGNMLQGIVGMIMGSMQTIILGTVQQINRFLRFFNIGEIDTKSLTKDMNKETDKFLNEGGAKSAMAFTDGMKSGMEANKNKLANATRGIVGNSLVDAAEDELLIKSPSYKGHMIGENFVNGVAQGIYGSEDLIWSASTKLAEAMQNPIKNSIADMQRMSTLEISYINKEQPTPITGSTPYANYQGLSPAQVVASRNSTMSSYETIYGNKPNPVHSASNLTEYGTVTKPSFTIPAQAAGYAYLSIAKAKAEADYKAQFDFKNDAVRTLMMSADFNRVYGAQAQDPEFIKGLLKTSETGEGFGARDALYGITAKTKLDEVLNTMGYAGGLAEYVQTSDFASADFLKNQSGINGTSMTRDQLVDKIIPSFTQAATTTAPSSYIQTHENMTVNKQGNKPSRFALKQLEYSKSTAKSSKLAADAMRTLGYYDKGTYMPGANPLGNRFFNDKYGGPASETFNGMYYTSEKPFAGINMGHRGRNKDQYYDKQLGLYVKSMADTTNTMISGFNGAALAVIENAKRQDIDAQSDKPNAPAFPKTDIERYTSINPYNASNLPTGPFTPIGGININRGMADGLAFGSNEFRNPNLFTVQKIRKTYKTAQKGVGKIKSQNQQQGYIPVSQLPQAASFFSDQLVPEQYDSEFGDVSTAVAGFKMQYGDTGVKFHGLTDTFANTPGLMEQYGQVGNRAATFLSLKKGQKMTAEDYAEFQRLMALDRADKERYLTAAGKLQTELNAIDKDPALTAQQKAQKKAKAVQGMQWDNTALTGSYRDILGVNVGNLGDYDKKVADGEITGDAKTYADTAFQRVREGISTAVDPKNQSAAFKALTPEEQDKLKKAVGDLPLAASAYLGQAMMDGVMTNDERILMEMYSQQDAERLGRILAAGVMPTQADIDAGFQPYVDGTAKFADRKNITGTMAETFLSGYDNIVAGAALANGQLWTTNFIKGVGTDKDGNKIDVANLTTQQILALDPATIEKNGMLIGESLPGGIAKGITAGATEIVGVLVEELGEGGNVLSATYTAIKKESPSKLYRDEVGLPMIQGVAKGISENAYLVSDAMAAAVGASSAAIPAGGAEGMGDVGSEGASRAAAGAASLNSGPFFAMGRQSATQFIAGFFNEQTPAESLFHKLFYKLQIGFTPDAKSQQAISLFTAASDLGRLLARKVVDIGFAEYIDNKEGKSDWTFNTVLATALGHTSDGSGADGWGVAAEKVGENIAAGVAKGMNNEAAKAAIKAAAEKLIAHAILMAEKAGTIESPSKLFADRIGANITAGVAMGIGENSNLVDNAISGIISSPVQRNYQPDISAVALAGKRQAAISQISNEYNYNLGVTTNQSPQLVQRSFAVMSAFQGE